MSCKCLVPCAHRHKMVSGWNCSTDKSLIGTVRNRGWVRMGSLVLQGRHYLGTLCLVGTWGNSVSRAVVALFLMSSCLGKHSSISGVKSCSESRANYQLVTAEDACSCSVALESKIRGRILSCKWHFWNGHEEVFQGLSQLTPVL